MLLDKTMTMPLLTIRDLHAKAHEKEIKLEEGASTKKVDPHRP
jgi:hypothetical protein